MDISAYGNSGVVLGIALVFAGYLLWRGMHLTRVESWSMYPSLKPGARLMTVSRFPLQRLRRGDILVFRSKELDGIFIKRLIGLPGDHVEIREGVVYIDGRRLEEPYVAGTCTFYGSFDVPPGRYFFLGDNREFSSDSRVWEDPFIGGSDIQGKVLSRRTR